ncbi:MAG: tRNA lysidine(34) synthetase TilS, partial [Candidatus Aminicenantes bacterium]|nr:tRNA lysidine(34) synthetase TilS [Candidatus Aminicenantes bacterium]
MKSFKKLKDLMIDQKIPQDTRDRVPVFCDDDKILWVAGIRMDERVRVK